MKKLFLFFLATVLIYMAFQSINPNTNVIAEPVTRSQENCFPLEYNFKSEGKWWISLNDGIAQFAWDNPNEQFAIVQGAVYILDYSVPIILDGRVWSRIRNYEGTYGWVLTMTGCTITN